MLSPAAATARTRSMGVGAMKNAASYSALWLGMFRNRPIGDRRVLQREHEGTAEVGIDVADPDPVAGFGAELPGVRQLRDLEVASDRRRERLVLVGSEAAHEPVGGKHGEAPVLECDQAHQDVPVRALAADLLGVHARRLVAVVA